MKQQMSVYSSQQGFTLLEALIALILLSIIVIGSGVILNQMLQTQKRSYINGIIVDQMQARLQGVIGSPSSATDLCGSINKDSFIVDRQTYFVGCRTQPIVINTSTINWPILAVDTSQDNANACAQAVVDKTTPNSSCYIVGN